MTGTLDCSIVPHQRHKGLFLVETTDFFYPLIEDAYLQGRIGCANVLSDLYAMGVVDCDNMLMILAASLDMDAQARDVVTAQMMKGFADLAAEAGTSVSGGQSILNPWPIIGGVATSLVSEAEMIRPEQAAVGDVLVLTKALGTQVAVNAHQALHKPASWDRIKGVISEAQAKAAYDKAVASMTRLNRAAARLMHKHGAHGATDVTGFGILGHAQNLAKNQAAAVAFEIHTLPILAHMAAVNGVIDFGLMRGTSSETSGGLLVALPERSAQAFCDELQSIDGAPAWIVGAVVAGERTAAIVPEPTVVSV